MTELPPAGHLRALDALGDERLRELRGRGAALDDDRIAAYALDAIDRVRAGDHGGQR